MKKSFHLGKGPKIILPMVISVAVLAVGLVIATDLVTENFLSEYFSAEIKRKSESAIKNFESIREDIEKSLEWIEGSSLAANAAAAEEFTSMISDLIGQTDELKEKISDFRV